MTKSSVIANSLMIAFIELMASKHYAMATCMISTLTCGSNS